MYQKCRIIIFLFIICFRLQFHSLCAIVLFKQMFKIAYASRKRNCSSFFDEVDKMHWMIRVALALELYAIRNCFFGTVFTRYVVCVLHWNFCNCALACWFFRNCCGCGLFVNGLLRMRMHSQVTTAMKIDHPEHMLMFVSTPFQCSRCKTNTAFHIRNSTKLPVYLRMNASWFLAVSSSFYRLRRIFMAYF